MLIRSNLLGQFSGSTGGVTGSRNRYGQYIRARSNPVNPTSSRQSSTRDSFRTAVNLWTNGTTAEERQAWTAYADAVPWINAVGDVIKLTGQAMFIRTQQARLQAGLAVSTNAPDFLNLGTLALTSAAVNATSNVAGEVTLTWNSALATWGAPGTGWSLLMTPGQNPSRNFPGSRWQQVARSGVIAVALTSPLVIPYTYPSYAASGDQRVWVRFRAISTDNRVSESQILGPYVVT